MEAGPQVDRSAARRPRDTLLLVLNVAIVVIGVAVVWAKLRERSGLGQQEIPVLDTTSVPIGPRSGGTGTGGTGTVVLRPADTAIVAPGPGDDPAQLPGVGPDPGLGEAGLGEASAAAHPGATRAEGEPSDEPAPTRFRGQVDAHPSPPPPRAQPAPASVHALAATEAVIDRIGVDVEVLHSIGGHYPSSSASYGTNRGIEALHVALAKVGKTSTLRLGDTDDDGRLEILDAWGRPLIYFSPDDYRTTQRWVPGDGEALDVGACRSAASQSFHAAASYQLWSVGPDGRAGGGRHDDITSWVRTD